MSVATPESKEIKTEIKAEKVESYEHLLIPLKRIVVDNYTVIMDSLPLDANNATVIALRATLQTLHGLWHLADAEWRKTRETIHIGLVKETKRHGNTSVSMGCATQYFAKNPERSGVAFLNCGTGGIKYQYYRKDNGIIYVALEHKPKDGASPNGIEISGFKPKVPVGYVRNVLLLNNELYDFRHNVDVMFPDVADTYSSVIEGPSSVETFAFITGSIREFWEQQNHCVSSLNMVMTEYFRSVMYGSCGVETKPFGDSFFLKQETEGALELLGTSKMYENLSSAGLIKSGSLVVSSFGIGRGSVQFPWNDPRDSTRESQVGFKAGMNKPDALAGLPWSAIPSLKAILPLINEYASHCETPVIALKSGCMLWLESDEGAETRKLFMTKQMLGDALLHNIFAHADKFRGEISQAFFQYSADMTRALDLPMITQGNKAIVHDGRVASSASTW